MSFRVILPSFEFAHRGFPPHADRVAWLQVPVLLGTLSMALLLAGCAYSHIATSVSTFEQPVTNGALELRITRHLDTIVHGPDDEEDQVLTLRLRDVRLNEKLKIPSDGVTPEFVVTRFGPRSNGEEFKGYVIVQKIGSKRVDAYLHLDVVARTASGTYKQTAKFHGNYNFRRRSEETNPVQ